MCDGVSQSEEEGYLNRMIREKDLHNDPYYIACGLMLDVSEQVVKLAGQPKSRSRFVRKLMDAEPDISIVNMVTACQKLGLKAQIKVRKKGRGRE